MTETIYKYKTKENLDYEDYIKVWDYRLKRIVPKKTNFTYIYNLIIKNKDIDINSIIIGGKITKEPVLIEDSEYEISDNDSIILCDTSSNSITVTIPTAQTEDGRELVIKDYGGNSNTNNITVDTEGSETIDGESDITINTDYDSVTIICKNNDWYII